MVEKIAVISTQQLYGSTLVMFYFYKFQPILKGPGNDGMMPSTKWTVELSATISPLNRIHRTHFTAEIYNRKGSDELT